MGLAAAVYARTMRALLPPGRLWRSPGGLIDQLLLGTADELARLDARADDLLVESEPTTTTELVSEYETELNLSGIGLTLGQRRAQITARYLARQRFRPADFQTALAPMLEQIPEDVDVVQLDVAQAVSMEDVREVYRFFIIRNPDLPGVANIAGAQALVDRISPAHTKGHVIERFGFLCDDPHSLCDRDLIGVG